MGYSIQVGHLGKKMTVVQYWLYPWMFWMTVIKLLLFAGVAEPVNVTDNGDGTHTVAYTPSVEGSYSVAVKYADQEIPRRYFC